VARAFLFVIWFRKNNTFCDASLFIFIIITMLPAADDNDDHIHCYWLLLAAAVCAVRVRVCVCTAKARKQGRPAIMIIKAIMARSGLPLRANKLLRIILQ
jgi:hypothetical protein